MSLKLGRITVTHLQLKNGCVVLTGPTAPEDGVTGANIAGPGSLYSHCEEDTGALYFNVGARDAPRWKRLLMEG